MVCGFAFSEDRKSVILIKKNRPEWQKGRLNGVGGHIEKGESPLFAMTREFEEETGLYVKKDRWTGVVTMTGVDWRVFFFQTTLTGLDVHMVRSMTDETLVKVACDVELGEVAMLPNLSWLLPLCLDESGVELPLDIIDRTSMEDE